MIRIPVPDQNSSVVEASLGEITYFLRLDWNAEAQIWTMGIANARNEDVLRGVVLVPNTPLLGQFQHLRIPPGEFVAYVEDDQIGRNTFANGRARLLYLTEDDLAAL